MTASRQRPSLLQYISQAYLRRPQALLFLGISYALWASVTLRWVMEFMENEHPATPLIAGLLLLFGFLMGLEPLLTVQAPARGHVYLLFQLALIVAAMLMFMELDFFAILLLPLTGQAIFILARRTAAIWIGAFMVANLLGQIHQFGWPGALPFIFLYTAAILFVAAFSHITLRADASRRRSETLLAELQAAHEQLRAYAGQAEELAVAQERNRLARELHDSVAQTLYGLTLQSEAAARKLAARQLDQVADYLQFFQTSTQQTLQETRLLIFELRPSILDDVGLAAALQARLDAVERRSGLHCQVHLDDVEALPPQVEMALYRIAQEALNNVLKHARADTVELALSHDGQSVHLQIADDGQGFEPQTARQGGYGLQGMEERAEQVGASLTLQSVPGAGTRVTVEVPL